MTSDVPRPRSVDMIVAVHDTRRQVARAVGSILANPDPSIQALVVAHNLPTSDVELALAGLMLEHPERIRIIECHDGIPSPSGPFNLGLSESRANYVGIMGSDDELDLDAIADWRRRLERPRADMVIAKVVRGPLRNLVRSPPKRVWRTGRLDFAKDRLSYRSAPLGLMRREAVDRLGLRLLEGARNGGDLPFVTRLWLLGHVVPSRGQASYVEHADAPVRVTHVAKPAREELDPVRVMLADPLIGTMSPAQLEALATKLVRRNLSDAVRKRDGGRALTKDDCAVITAIAHDLVALAPRTLRLVGRSQAEMFAEVARPQPDLARVAELDAETIRFDSQRSVLPADLTLLLSRQGQLRYVAASALIRVGASRWFDPIRILTPLLGAGALALVVAAIARAR